MKNGFGSSGKEDIYFCIGRGSEIEQLEGCVGYSFERELLGSEFVRSCRVSIDKVGVRVSAEIVFSKLDLNLLL